MPSNTAAWLVQEKMKPLEVRPAPYTCPGEHEIVIKNAAVAINPIDWKLQDFAVYPLSYPAILGEDVSGEVVEVGSSVTRFRVGDRVLGPAIGMASHRTSDGAFQDYTVVSDFMSSPIPSSISFEAAAVIPLGSSTAAVGLYKKDYLELQVLLVWGGASSVGSNGIQLGVASGFEVITTASPKNFEYVKKLGASQAFDYKSQTILKELIGAMKGKTTAGVLDRIGISGVAETCAEFLRNSHGGKLIASTTHAAENLSGGVIIKRIFGIVDNEVGKAVYEDYLPKALAEGTFVPAPDPIVVGNGLHSKKARYRGTEDRVRKESDYYSIIATFRPGRVEAVVSKESRNAIGNWPVGRFGEEGKIVGLSVQSVIEPGSSISSKFGRSCTRGGSLRAKLFEKMSQT